MKKSYLKSMALVACLLLGMSATAQVRGDVTGDGNVDIADVNEVINIMLGKSLTPNPSPEGEGSSADVTGDGSVDIADVNEIINIMLGKTSQEVQTYTVNGVSFKMVAVEGGTFSMGATEEQGDDAYGSEKPVHQVTLSSYSIGQTEVTQKLWLAVMGSNPSYFQASTDPNYGTNLQRPVEQVSWNDCQEFIDKLNELTGKTFRLPTEAEWEYAARGGNKSQGYKFSGSNNVDDVAWYIANIPSQTSGDSGYGAQTVATKAPNELGLYDMSGNVWEWCQDGYDYYSSDPQTNPTGPLNSATVVFRGGSWCHGFGSCRVSMRNNCGEVVTDSYIGFRLAL